MNRPNVKLLDDRVLVKPDEKINETEHGLYIPEAAQKDMHQGEIIAIGDGLIHPNAPLIKTSLSNILTAVTGTQAQTHDAVTYNVENIDKLISNGDMKVAVGDRVVYGKFSGTELEISGVKYIMMLQNDIKLIMKKETDSEQLKKQ